MKEAHIYRDELFPVYFIDTGKYYDGSYFNITEDNLGILLEEQKEVWKKFTDFQEKLESIYEKDRS